MNGVIPGILAGLLLTSTAAPALPQDVPAGVTQPQQPVLSSIRLEGVSVYTPEQLQRRHGLVPGEPLKAPPDTIATEIQKRYIADGYTFAEVTASIDADGVLTIRADEGEIGAIEFHGVGAELDSRLREAFAMRPGDIFNRAQANRALHHALETTHGAVVRGDGRVFAMRRENGRRILELHLRTRTDRSRPFLGTQGREDWYSPVDGFNPAFGFQTTIFDARNFNHTYAAASVSYKFAAERVGYGLGFERPFFTDGVLQAGASIQDLTASDDRWRLSETEQSLVALTFRNTFRDYYRRKGWQAHAAVRPFDRHEWLVAWRDEYHAALSNETGWGVFRDDHPFRANALAQDGDLRAVVLGYTFDTRGLTRESPGDRFRRHQLDDLFQSVAGGEHGARIEWHSELAPAALDHDFDFSRHIVNARVWLQTSPGRIWSARAIGGFGDRTLPPQRLFGLGGVGTVHGYAFKEASGERMLLLNGEVRQRLWRTGTSGLAFIDVGRVYRPRVGSTEEWLKGVGVGLEFGGSSRVEFGWRLDDVPSSLQVLFRLNAPW